MKVVEAGNVRYVDIRISVNDTEGERAARTSTAVSDPAAGGGTAVARGVGLADVLYPRGAPPRHGADADPPEGGAESDFEQVFLRADERLRDMERALREPARVVITLGGPERPGPSSAPPSAPASEVAAPYRSPLRTAGMAAASYSGSGRGVRPAIIDIKI